MSDLVNALNKISDVAIAGANSINISQDSKAARAQAYELFREQYNQQRDLMDKQNEIALQHWNLENAYNSPSAQMERYLQAGINPYNVLSNTSSGNSNTIGSVGLGSAPSAPNISELYSPQRSGVANFMSTLQQATQTSSVALQNTQSSQMFPSILQSSQNQAQQLKNDMINEPARISAAQSMFQSQLAQNTYNTAYFTLKANGVSDIVNSEISSVISSATQAKLLAKRYGLDNMITSIDAACHKELMDTTIANLKKQGKLTDEQVEQIKAGITNAMRLTDAQVGLINAQKETENASRQAKVDLLRAQQFFNEENASDLMYTRPARLTSLRETAQALQNQNKYFAPTGRQHYWEMSNRRSFFPSIIGSIMSLGYEMSEMMGSALGGVVSSAAKAAK